MGVIVQFNYNLWIARFPEFINVNPDLAGEYFLDATDLWRNDGIGPCNDAAQQLRLLNMVTAHLAWLYAPRDQNGNPASAGVAPANIIGHINTATEGSVSVGADVGDVTAGGPSQAFWMQSRYGFQFWQATAQWRNARYLARPTLVGGPIYWPGWGRRF